MKLHHRLSGTATRKYSHLAAAVLAFVLSIFAAPAALAEPFEGDLSGTSTAQTEPHRGWEHRNDLEFLNQHDEAAQPSATGNAQIKWPQGKLESLVGQEAGAGPDESSAVDSGLRWLLGAGVVATVAVASILAVIVRSRRQDIVTPIRRDRDTLNV